MQSQSDDSLKVMIAADGMSATLTIRPNFDVSLDPKLQVRAALQERGVAITSDVLAAIDEALQARGPKNDADFEFVVARGLPPQHGSGGLIRFETKFNELAQDLTFRGRALGADGELAVPIESALATDDDEESVNHRERTSLLIVEEGEKIAQILPPEDGTDGVDVRGKVLACKQAQHFELKHDRTIEVSSDGSVVATCAGMLFVDDGKLKIERELRVRDYVDFNTGNIRFRGDVHVRQGVRDGFLVDVDGVLTVGGLIEAADIRTTGDARFARGMAGRDKGSIRIGKSLSAHYLDSVRGSVGLDLRVDKEIVHCDVSVGRQLHAVHATVIGGRLAVTGPAELKVLGSPSQATTLIVGRVETLDDLLDQAWEMRNRVAQMLEEAKEKHDVYKRAAGKVVGAQAQELAALAFEVCRLEAIVSRLEQALCNGEQTASRIAQVDVRVLGQIHAKSILQIRHRLFRFKLAVKGPLRITESSKGHPVLTDDRTGSSASLTDFAIEQDDRKLRRAS